MRGYLKVLGLGIAGCALAATVAAQPQNGRDGNPDFKGGPRAPTELNPKGLPGIPTCKKIDLSDPQALLKTNLAKDDRRPFMIYGFTRTRAPGIFCPDKTYRMDRLGGTFVSDIRDACGAYTASNAKPEQMQAYNRALAADPEFQRITGCRPSDICEEKYANGARRETRDAECPGNLKVFTNVAIRGDRAALSAALQDFTDGSAASRQAMTDALVGALQRAKWDNAQALMEAGADVNGERRANRGAQVTTPLAAVFYQSMDKEARVARAEWLMSKGADFSNPATHSALSYAARSADEASVAFLLAKGVPVSGDVPTEQIDARAKASFDEGTFAPKQTPFYRTLSRLSIPRSVSSGEAAAKLAKERAALRRIAVSLYERGARFQSGQFVDNLRRQPQVKVASIALAAAHRDGRFAELLDHWLYPKGKDAPLRPAGASADRLAMVDYLEALKGCAVISPKPMGDYVKLCAGGSI